MRRSQSVRGLTLATALLFALGFSPLAAAAPRIHGLAGNPPWAWIARALALLLGEGPGHATAGAKDGWGADPNGPGGAAGCGAGSCTNSGSELLPDG